MKGQCNDRLEAAKQAWKKVSEQAKEVERGIGRIQRTPEESAAWYQALGDLEAAYNSANAQVREAQQATIILADTCFE